MRFLDNWKVHRPLGHSLACPCVWKLGQALSVGTSGVWEDMMLSWRSVESTVTLFPMPVIWSGGGVLKVGIVLRVGGKKKKSKNEALLDARC